MFGIFLRGSVARAMSDGSASSIEDYCNQNGCNYEDVFEKRRVRNDDDINDRFCGWAYDED